MAVQTWVAALGPFVPNSGTALATSTTLSDISPAPSIPLPANLFQFVGQEIEIHAFGSFSNTVTPTLLIGAYYGGVAGVALAATAATTTASGVTGVPWQLYYRGQVRALGSSGSIVGQGRVYLGTSLTACSVIPIPATAAARTVTIDTTSAKTITIGAQWGTSSASNTITCDDIAVKLSV